MPVFSYMLGWISMTEETRMPGAQPEKKSVPEREEEILAYWKDKHIFAKTLDATRDGEPYVFYDGPPFATGLPHYGHLLAGTIKDVIPRFQTMRGRYVRREWGWDCHGLPIENLIEKELGFKTKKDIENYGIANFNKKAKDSVLAYDKEWKAIVPRMGRFVDMESAYKTMDPSYTESIWWAFKTLFNKKLIYEGYKSMHICPRCETTLAISEVGMNYMDVKDISVTVEFALLDPLPNVANPERKTSALAWTTTPWTLPGNVALAVGAEIEYVLVEKQDTDTGPLVRFIVAKDLLEKNFGSDGYSIVATFPGSDLVGLRYRPPFNYYAQDEKLENHKNGWKIYTADFVTAENGTGIAHEAPAFGEVDMELGKKMKLPFIQHVGMDGHMKPEVKDFAGMPVKPKSDDDKVRLGTDIAIIRYLQEHGTFFAKENITHSYPHCWRCDWPLLNYAASSWFVAVTEIKEKLLDANRGVSWIPENMRDGRFGKWLEGARDWAISRSRYWGAPLPVWKCNKCAKIEVLGSLDELRARVSRKNRYLLMRHGEAENNVQNVVSYKLTDTYHLTEKGKEQVTLSIEKLKAQKIDLIYASPILRTKETALLVAEALGATVVYDDRLLEANTGTFNGKSIEEYRAYFTSVEEKMTKRPPEGETLEEMKTRLAEFLYDIEAKNEGKTILIVTHEYDVWLLESAAKGLTNHESAVLRDGEGEDFIGNGAYCTLAFAPIPHNERYELDFHRPYSDDIRYQCSCELGTMERVPEVFDCWFESGSMPYAQLHYMGDDETAEGKLFRSQFPADFIAEGIDQTRGWFYTLIILGVGLFDQAPYKSVMVNGLVLAQDGQKMSKSKKNYPDPMDIVNKYGADAIRFYLVSSSVIRAEDFRFAAAGVDEIFKKIVLRVGNILSFLETYGTGEPVLHSPPASKNILDRWIVARWNEVLTETTRYLESHEIDYALRPIPKFVDDLSTWYLRRSRERFKSDDKDDAAMAQATTGWVLLSFAKLIAPVMPFLAEDIYLRLNVAEKKESIHLEKWPVGEGEEEELVDAMEDARRIVSLALEERARKSIKVRQPLSSLRVQYEWKWRNAYPFLAEIIKDEINVEEINWSQEISTEIELDTNITPELEAKRELRDAIRVVQDARKKSALVPGETVELITVTGAASTIVAVRQYESEFKKAVNASSVETKEGELGVEIKK